MQLHLVLICIEVIYGVFHSIKCFDMRHFELCRKREVQHLGCEWGFRLLHQSINRDWNSALLIKDGPIASVVPTMPLLITILSRGFIGVMLPGLASLCFSICFSRRVEVLLFFLGNDVLAFSGLSLLLGVLYFPGELLQLF